MFRPEVIDRNGIPITRRSPPPLVASPEPDAADAARDPRSDRGAGAARREIVSWDEV